MSRPGELSLLVAGQGDPVAHRLAQLLDRHGALLGHRGRPGGGAGPALPPRRHLPRGRGGLGVPLPRASRRRGHRIGPRGDRRGAPGGLFGRGPSAALLGPARRGHARHPRAPRPPGPRRRHQLVVQRLHRRRGQGGGPPGRAGAGRPQPRARLRPGPPQGPAGGRPGPGPPAHRAPRHRPHRDGAPLRPPPAVRGLGAGGGGGGEGHPGGRGAAGHGAPDVAAGRQGGGDRGGGPRPGRVDRRGGHGAVGGGGLEPAAGVGAGLRAGLGRLVPARLRLLLLALRRRRLPGQPPGGRPERGLPAACCPSSSATS